MVGSNTFKEVGMLTLQERLVLSVVRNEWLSDCTITSHEIVLLTGMNGIAVQNVLENLECVGLVKQLGSGRWFAEGLERNQVYVKFLVFGSCSFCGLMKELIDMSMEKMMFELVELIDTGMVKVDENSAGTKIYSAKRREI